MVAEPEERTIGATMELLGEERVLWGSDYPHIDSTLAAASPDSKFNLESESSAAAQTARRERANRVPGLVLR